MTEVQTPPTARGSGKVLSYGLGGWYILIVVFLAFGVATPLLAAANAGTTIGTYPGLLALLVCVYAAAKLGHLLAAASQRFVTAVFWMFVYVWFGLAPFLQLDADHFYRIETQLHRTHTESQRFTGMLVVWLGLFAYEVGQLVVSRRRAQVGGAEQAPRQARSVLSLHRLRTFTACSVLFCLFVLVGFSDIAALFSSREGLGDELAGNWLTSRGLRFPILVAAFLCVYYVRRSGLARWSSLGIHDKALFSVAVVLAVVVNNPISSPRYLVATVWAALMFAAVLPGTRKLFRVAVAGLLIGSIFVFPFADYFRREVQSELQIRSIQDSLVMGGDYGMYSQLQVGLEYVDEHGFTMGEQILASVFNFVPRSIWTGKPIDTGDLTHQAAGFSSNFNFSFPLWGELYVDGGVLFVLGGFLLYGYVSRRLDDWSSRPDLSKTGLSSALCILFAAVQPFILRGALRSSLPLFMLMVALAALCYRYRPRRDPGRPTPARPLARAGAAPPSRPAPGGPRGGAGT